jgi:ubiquinone/menaquinone biosynthesis C-methylase UbiE
MSRSTLSERSFTMSTMHPVPPAPHAHGKSPGVIHWAKRYDLLTWLLYAGRPGRTYGRLAALVPPAPGEAVLDVGSGSGRLTLALAAQALAGAATTGVDASPEMVALATAKARKRGPSATFQVARAEALPFPDSAFDTVTTCLTLHHLADDQRPLALQEIVRVLRPGGRLLVVEFRPPSGRVSGKVLGHVLGGHMMGLRREAFLDLVRALPVDAVEVADVPGASLYAIRANKRPAS